MTSVTEPDIAQGCSRLKSMNESFSGLTAEQLNRARLKAAIRMVSCIADTGHAAPDTYEQRFPGSMYARDFRVMQQKADVGAANPGSWGSVVLPIEAGRVIVEASDPLSVVRRLSLVRTPFATRVPSETTAMAGAAWIGNLGAALPVLEGAFESTSLVPLSLGGLLVLTEEVVRSASPAGMAFLENRILSAVASFLDAQFVDPTITAVTNLRPASVTNGVTPIVSLGSSAEAAVADVRELVATYVANGARLESAALLMNSQNAVLLRLSGHEAFRELGPTGGRVAGIPTFAGDGVGANLILVDQARILYADTDSVDFAKSNQATLQMDSAPTMHAGTATAVNATSLWQTHSVALRAIRTANWEALDDAVQYVAGADYSGIGSPA